MRKSLSKLFLLLIVCLLVPAGQAQAARKNKHVIQQITSLTEGTLSQPRIEQARGDFVTFTSDGDVMGPGTATLGQREVYLYEAAGRTTSRITTTVGGESWDASRVTDDFRSSRPPIIAFISSGDLDTSVGNSDGNPELFIWISTTGEFRQITNTSGGVITAEPRPSDSGRCIVFESTGNIDNNPGLNDAAPPTGFTNTDGSREIFYVDFTDSEYKNFNFTQVSNGPAGSNSTDASVGGFFFPIQCEFMTYQSDFDQLGNGSTAINSYLFRRPSAKTTLVSVPGNTGGISQQPMMAGTGVVTGGPSMVFSTNVDIVGNGSTGFQIFKYRLLHPILSQYTATTSGSNMNPTVSDGGARLVVESTAELVNPARKARQGGPGPFNADGNAEIVRLEGRRRVRPITRTTGCTNRSHSLSGSGRGVAFLSTCNLISGVPGAGQEQVFVYNNPRKRKSPLLSVEGCKVIDECCNVASGCYQSNLGRAIRPPRKIR